MNVEQFFNSLNKDQLGQEDAIFLHKENGSILKLKLLCKSDSGISGMFLTLDCSYTTYQIRNIEGHKKIES